MRQKILIREGARDNALQMFLPLFQKRGIDVTVSQLKQALLKKFTTEASIHNLSLRSNYYLLGVARYYFEGKLTSNQRLNLLYPNVKDRFDEDICKRLNVLIEILRNAYIDSIGTQFEQPEDFGNLTLEKLLRKYNKKINKALGMSNDDKENNGKKIDDDYSAGKNYTYEILYSCDDAQKYYKATCPGAWCITYGQQHYNSYIRNLGIHYVIFRQDGFENVPRKVGPGFTKQKPHDAYGNSLIAVLQSNKSPDPIYITSRWNHGSSEDGTQGTEADHAYTTEEFLNVIGADYSVLERAYGQWKAKSTEQTSSERSLANQYKTEALRALKYDQMLINGGKNPMEIEHLFFKPLDQSNEYPKMNGPYTVTISLGNDIYYTTIMDRKKMMLDKLFIKSDYLYISKKGKHNTLIECIGSKRPHIIYNTTKRKLVELDGEVAFKTTSFGSNFGMAAMSGNQVALFKLENGEPVRARNGGVWFEAITSAVGWSTTNFKNQWSKRGISIPFRPGGIMKMVYDSSANDTYIYNTNTERFIDLQYDDINNISFFCLNSQFYRVSFVEVDESYKSYCKIYDCNNDTFLSFNGTEKLRYAVASSDSSSKIYIVITPLSSNENYFYIPTTHQFVQFNGKPLCVTASNVVSQFNSCGYVNFKFYNVNGGYETYHVLINPYDDKVATVCDDCAFIEDLDYTPNDTERKCIARLGGKSKDIRYAEDAYRQDINQMKSARSEFKEIYKRIGKKAINE